MLWAKQMVSRTYGSRRVNTAVKPQLIPSPRHLTLPMSPAAVAAQTPTAAAAHTPA
jgi:hypothetical protein